MATATTELRFEPLSPVLGARVRGLDLTKPIGEAAQAELRSAWARYGVLCVPAPGIAVDDQISYAAVFGKVDAEGNGHLRFEEGEKRPKRGIMYISNLKENGENVGALPDGELHFHSDGAHRASPWKDGSPGQSTRLIFRPCQLVCASESEIDICRLCSSSSQSVTVVPASIVPSRLTSPAWNRSASTSDVLPVPR